MVTYNIHRPPQRPGYFCNYWPASLYWTTGNKNAPSVLANGTFFWGISFTWLNFVRLPDIIYSMNKVTYPATNITNNISAFSYQFYIVYSLKFRGNIFNEFFITHFIRGRLFHFAILELWGTRQILNKSFLRLASSGYMYMCSIY